MCQTKHHISEYMYFARMYKYQYMYMSYKFFKTQKLGQNDIDC